MATLAQLRSEASSCTRCPLYELATQTVFGEGPARAVVMMVGEQPGDQEDRQGHPFVGPAGHLLDLALTEAGIDRDQVYVTNAVKHFKWTPRGKRRIHATPNQTEIVACRPWLEGEVEAVQPKAIVALGATAAQALFGREFRVTRQRGEVLPLSVGGWSGVGVATVHPSAILRAPNDEARSAARTDFVNDLNVVREQLAKFGTA
jgi:uracil-DNA glycosylase family protein